MAKSVAEHLKGLMSNGIMGTALNFASGLTQSTSGAQGKVAAQLLKKSPFEINDSPVESVKRAYNFLLYHILEIWQRSRTLYTILHIKKQIFSRHK